MVSDEGDEDDEDLDDDDQSEQADSTMRLALGHKKILIHGRNIHLKQISATKEDGGSSSSDDDGSCVLGRNARYCSAANIVS
jgi:hypothetical protein